jgi:hypothetical protein
MASTSLNEGRWGAAGRRLSGLSLPRVRPTRYLIALWLVLAAALAFYLWIVATSSPSSYGDIYNLMTTGFLHGHLYLPIQVPGGLLHLKDPYDPAQNGPYQAAYHDLALRNGHLYSTWGPSPTLLFLLFRLTPWQLSQAWAVAIYAFIGLVCAVWLLHVLVRRLIPGTPNWLLLVATAGLALTNAVPFLLRRPAQYELAITGGYCFEMAGLLLVVTAVLDRPARLRRLALGSLLLGLAAAARPTLAVGGLVVLAAGIYLIRWRGDSRRVLVPALVPVVVCGLLIGAYNDVRFGSASEFGQHYQFASIDVQHKPTDQLSFVPPGMFSYLAIPARISLTFPHFFLRDTSVYPGTLPAGYSGTDGVPIEPAGGMFPTMPITLLLFALPSLWIRRKRSERGALIAATGLAGLCFLVIFLLSYALWGTTQRYEVDFATFGLLAAFLVWALLLARASAHKVRRRVTIVAGLLLTLFGMAVGTAVSFTGYYDQFQLTHNGTFRTLEDITSPLPTLATMIAGHPVLTRVFGASVIPPPVSYTSFGERGASAYLGSQGPVTVTVISPGSDHTSLTASASTVAGAPPLSKMIVWVQSPGKAPVAVHMGPARVRLPIDLHLGLNRILLTLVSPSPTAPQELALAGLSLGH